METALQYWSIALSYVAAALLSAALGVRSVAHGLIGGPIR